MMKYHELVNPFVMKKEVKKKFILINCQLHHRKENICHVQRLLYCNLCMVEDLGMGKVVLQYRSPEKTHWLAMLFQVAISKKEKAL